MSANTMQGPKSVAHAVLHALDLMTEEERVVFFDVLTAKWCPHCGAEQDPRGCTCRRDD